MRYVPVIASDRQPLMPTSPRRARRLTERGEATPFWRKGVYCIRLNRDPSGHDLQSIAVGVDPGSKKEGFSVVGERHTYLNVQVDAITHVSDAITDRRYLRRGRRFRNTPCRANRRNRGSLTEKRVPPSTKARWDWKLRILKTLRSIFPFAVIIVEDVEASTRKGKRRWNSNFSPLQIGKARFYRDASRIAPLVRANAYVSSVRRRLWFCQPKTKDKMAETFSAHAVDAWCLAARQVGALRPTQTDVLCWEQPKFHRRELHRQQPGKGGVRSPYGSTRSHGFKRGSLARHPKWGIVTIGGLAKDRLSLHHTGTGKRLTHAAKPADVRFLTYNHWRARFVAA